ncbi:hypothetical protein ACWDBW_02105 [Streptomyces sp. NPDC001107]
MDDPWVRGVLALKITRGRTPSGQQLRDPETAATVRLECGERVTESASRE